MRMRMRIGQRRRQRGRRGQGRSRRRRGRRRGRWQDAGKTRQKTKMTRTMAGRWEEENEDMIVDEYNVDNNDNDYEDGTQQSIKLWVGMQQQLRQQCINRNCRMGPPHMDNIPPSVLPLRGYHRRRNVHFQ